jgi:phage terminase large subunit
MWCFQILPDRINIVDYCESLIGNIPDFVRWLNGRGYKGRDYLPPTARMKDFSVMPTRTRLETMRKLGRTPVLIPDVKLVDRINAGRETFPYAYFDADHTERGRDCLKAFKAEWDEDAMVPKSTPAHNWASHAAFAFGHLAVSWELPRPRELDKIAEALKRLHERGVEDAKITVDKLLKLHRKGAGPRPGY